MRVIHFATTSLMHKNFILPLARYQRSQGIDVELGCSDALPAGYQPAIEELEREGFKVRIVSFPYEIRPFQDARAVLKLWRFFRANRYDVVHSHTSKAGILVRLAARLADRPLIVHTVHDFHFRHFRPGLKQAFFVWLERIAAWYTDVMLYSTETIREAALRRRIGEVERAVVVGGPIADLERFEASEREVAALRSELGLRPGEPVIACVSRLVDYKGIDTLLRAASVVLGDRPNVRFVIMGGGPLEGRLRAMAGDLGLGDRVVLTGFRRDDRDVLRLLALADLFCLPTRREGFGVAFAEAMAMGCPVVGPAIAPVTSVVTDGQTGFLVQPEEDRAYAAAMVRLLNDPALRARFGAAGKAHVRAQLDPRRMYEAVTAVYSRPHRVSRMLPLRKELFDRLAALVGLVAAIPVMVLVAIAIKLGHPSLPLLFVDTVVGKDAVPFRFYKFRTMLPHPIDYDDRPEILPGNPLVTRVGRWLRRFKLDELPQLFHVLFGQMSMVGPRPMDVRRFERASEFCRQRALVKPGLTGLAQVSGNIYLSWPERMEMDVWYLEHWSMRLDLEIIARTVGVILRGERIVDKWATTRRITDHSHRIRVRRAAPAGQP